MKKLIKIILRIVFIVPLLLIFTILPGLFVILAWSVDVNDTDTEKMLKTFWSGVLK